MLGQHLNTGHREVEGMDALIVGRFDAPDRAEIVLRDLERLQHRRRVTADDTAVVSWAAGAARPRAYQAGSTEETGLSGAFWGLVFSLAFLLPPQGTGGALDCVGLSDGFLRRLREEVGPGTSALFLLTRDGLSDDLRRTFADAEVIVNPIGRTHGVALRCLFAAG
jgi:uncharacterized membrane protein